MFGWWKDPTEATRAYAEHYATEQLGPRLADACWVENLGIGSSATRRDSPFKFTRQRHRELLLPDLKSLHALVSNLLGDRNERRNAVSLTDVQDYIRTRFLDRDLEWKTAIAAIEKKSSRREWVNFAFREQSGGDRGGGGSAHVDVGATVCDEHLAVTNSTHSGDL